MKDFFEWLVEYWHCLAVCGLIVYLLINESTRKITFKVLCGILLCILVIGGIPLLCVWIFGADGLFIGYTAILHILLLWALVYGVKMLQSTIRLHKNGTRTYGTLIRQSFSSRSSSVVMYMVNRKMYKCSSLSPLRKYEKDCDRVPVIYDAEKPEISCIEKHDFPPIIALLITYAVLEIGIIALTVYLCFHIFS